MDTREVNLIIIVHNRMSQAEFGNNLLIGLVVKWAINHLDTKVTMMTTLKLLGEKKAVMKTSSLPAIVR